MADGGGEDGKVASRVGKTKKKKHGSVIAAGTGSAH